MAVHVRHHDVHQDRIDHPGLALLKDLHGLATVPGLDNARAPLLEQKMRDLHVELVVLGDEDVEALDRRGLVTALLNGGLLIALVDRKRQQHVKGTAAPLFALHRDAAAHCVDQALCDRHAKTRPAVFGAHRFVLLRERLEQVLHELRRHAHARIAAFELDHNGIAVARRLAAGDVDLAVGLVVLDRVAQDVRHDPPEVHRAADQARVRGAAVRLHDLDTAALGLLDDGVVDAPRDLAQVERQVLEHDLARLELVHIEHLVDEFEQDICRLADLGAAVVAFGQVVAAALGDVEHADNAVEGRADVVAHAQQKVGFGPVRALGVGLGGDQLPLVGLFFLALLALLGQMLLDDVVDDLEPHEHVAGIVHLGYVELVMAHRAAVETTVGPRVLVLPARQDRANVLGAQLLDNALTILFVHAPGHPCGKHALVGKHLAFELHDVFEIVIFGDFEDLGGTVADIRLVDVAVAAREDIEDRELFLELALTRRLPLVRHVLGLDDRIDILKARDDVVSRLELDVLELIEVRLTIVKHTVGAAIFSRLAKTAPHAIQADGLMHRLAVVWVHALRDVLACGRGIVVEDVAICPHAGRHVTVELEYLCLGRVRIDQIDVRVRGRKGTEDGQPFLEMLLARDFRGVHSIRPYR